MGMSIWCGQKFIISFHNEDFKALKKDFKCLCGRVELGVKKSGNKDSRKTFGDIFLKACLALLDCGSNEHCR